MKSKNTEEKSTTFLLLFAETFGNCKFPLSPIFSYFLLFFPIFFLSFLFSQTQRKADVPPLFTHISSFLSPLSSFLPYSLFPPISPYFLLFLPIFSNRYEISFTLLSSPLTHRINVNIVLFLTQGGTMFYTGIDIGSTATKVVVFDEAKENILHKLMIPSGWNSKETSEKVLVWLKEEGVTPENSVIISTGYGRISVPYADKQITEITCHGKGALFLHPEDCTVIDIGGQDTKIIYLQDGMVTDFIMNDKCSAGTGKFLEIMANRLGVTINEIFELAAKGNPITISSMCTVFAESEVISLMGKGTPKEDIANGVIHSIIQKVNSQEKKSAGNQKEYFLTGGFCDTPYMMEELGKALDGTVSSHEDGRFAGAIGAALLGKKKS